MAEAVSAVPESERAEAVSAEAESEAAVSEQAVSAVPQLQQELKRPASA